MHPTLTAAPLPTPTQVSTHCPFCALQCAMTLTPAAGSAVVEAGEGGLCRKGWTSAALLDSPRRLTTPLVPDSRHGALREASWDEALDRAAVGFIAAQRTSGPDAVGVLAGGGLTNEKAYLLGKFARVALRTSQIDDNGRFCMSSGAAGGMKAFGLDPGLPFPLSDIVAAGTVLGRVGLGLPHRPGQRPGRTRSPHKVKMGASGCARECAEARSKDFGVIATENGWNLYVGGNGGFRPRHADLFLQDVDTATLVRTIDRVLMLYVFTADRLQRTAPWIEAMEGGLEHLRAVVMDDSLGVCAELDAAMERHVQTYSDEWADTLADPERLARFTAFVNAPDTPDPSITFVHERGQIRPARTHEKPLVAGPVLQIVRA